MRRPLALYDEALRIWRSSYGPEHPRLAAIYLSIGGVHRRERRFERALEAFQRGYEVRLAGHGLEHPYLAYDLANIGACLLELDRAREALGPIEDARKRWNEQPVGPVERASVQLLYGRALIATGSDRSRGRREVRKGVALLKAADSAGGKRARSAHAVVAERRIPMSNDRKSAQPREPWLEAREIDATRTARAVRVGQAIDPEAGRDHRTIRGAAIADGSLLICHQPVAFRPAHRSVGCAQPASLEVIAGRLAFDQRITDRWTTIHNRHRIDTLGDSSQVRIGSIATLIGSAVDVA